MATMTSVCVRLTGLETRHVRSQYTVLYFSPAARAGTPCCVVGLIVCGSLSTRTAALGMKRTFTDVHLYIK